MTYGATHFGSASTVSAPYRPQQAEDMRPDWAELPPLPEVGRPESYYAQQVKQAEQQRNIHAREAYKVAVRRDAGNGPAAGLGKELRYFKHALRSHCVAPAGARRQALDVLRAARRHGEAECGRRGPIRLASLEDDYYMGQVNAGVPRPQIMAQAEIFFRKILGERDEKPEYLNQEDYEQLRILRNQWI